MEKTDPKTGLVFKAHKPLDPLDVPFRIAGHQVRWIASHAQETKFGRPWKVLRKSQLPQDTIKALEQTHYSIFSDGDTIRRGGDLVLSFAPLDVVNQVKSENLQRAGEQMDRIRTYAPTAAHSVDKKNTSIEKVSASMFEK